MKITLISPKQEKGLTNISFFKLPPQGLIQLAALTTPDWEIEIIDENITPIPIDFDNPTDLVGLTAVTAQAQRAYQIAEQFKSRGVPTIMGGIHASELPYEASQYVDSVVIGEAETGWANILNDAKQARLRNIYNPTRPTSLEFCVQRKVQRTYLARFSSYLPFNFRFAYLQTQRGCPHDCDFCSVTSFNGRKVRAVDQDYLLAQIEQEMEQGFDLLVFVDDNILANMRYAKELFRVLIPLNIHWLSQTDIRIANDDIIDLACESGLAAVFLGLETISANTIKQASTAKQHWLPQYERTIKRLKEQGVVVEASFIFGFDHESQDVIKRTVDWAIEHRVDAVQFSILTPYPGTKLFSRLERQDRLLTRDWSKYTHTNCVHQPIGWDKEELEEGLKEAYQRFYSLSSIARRLPSFPKSQIGLGALLTNFDFRQIKL